MAPVARPVVRPPRTAAHRELQQHIARFNAAGLVPTLSTNGSNPSADIQIVKGPKGGDVPMAWVTARGEARLARG